jgi:hypothetical protein
VLSPTSKVLYEKGDRIAHITLNRPETLNAVDDELDEALRVETLNAYSSVGDFSEVNTRLQQFYQRKNRCVPIIKGREIIGFWRGGIIFRE